MVLVVIGEEGLGGVYLIWFALGLWRLVCYFLSIAR